MIVAIVESIVNALKIQGSSPEISPIFIHGEKSWQNLDADEVNRDVVFLDEPIRSNDQLRQGGYLEESYPLVFFFAEKSEQDWTPDQHQVVINRQREQRRKFINRLQIHEGIREISSMSTLDAKNIFDVNLSGVILYITILPFNDYTACP